MTEKGNGVTAMFRRPARQPAHESERNPLSPCSSRGIHCTTCLLRDVEAVQAYLSWSDLVSLSCASVCFFSKVKGLLDIWKVGDVQVKRRRENVAWCLGGSLPKHFTFCNDFIYPFGIPEGLEEPLEGCTCRARQCGSGDSSSSCSCVLLNLAAQSGKVILFECHEGCTCSRDCQLRASQQCNKDVPMQLEHVGAKGWGVFAQGPIPKGTFVSEYAGEVLPMEEARQRVALYDQQGLNYVVVAREFFQAGDRVLQTIVDATRLGNVSRFFNHACNPSLSMHVVRRGSLLPRLALFAKKDIAPGTELTFDYSNCGGEPTCEAPGGVPASHAQEPGEECRGSHGQAARGQLGKAALGEFRETAPGPPHSKALDESGGHPCLCGSQGCRGFLPFDRSTL